MKKLKEKFKNVNKKTLGIVTIIILCVFILLFLIILTVKVSRLSNQKDINKIQETQSESVEYESESPTEQQEDNNIVSDKKTIQKTTPSQPETPQNQEIPSINKPIESSSTSESSEGTTIKSADEEVLVYLNETKSNLDNVSLRDKVKENFITLVDFLFYDGSIKGHTFNELTTKTKLKVLQISLAIDQKIDHYFPDYKAKISNGTSRIYTNIKEKIVKKYLELTTSICLKDQELCSSAKNDFQDMKKSFSLTWDIIKNLASNGVSNLKSWYEIYSGK